MSPAEETSAAAKELASNAPMWGFLGVLVTGLLGLIGLRKKKASHQPPALSLHNVVLEIRDMMLDVKDKVGEQEVLLARLEERQVTKDTFNDKMLEARNHVDSLVSNVHEKLNEHIRDHSSAV